MKDLKRRAEPVGHVDGINGVMCEILGNYVLKSTINIRCNRVLTFAPIKG